MMSSLFFLLGGGGFESGKEFPVVFSPLFFPVGVWGLWCFAVDHSLVISRYFFSFIFEFPSRGCLIGFGLLSAPFLTCYFPSTIVSSGLGFFFRPLFLTQWSYSQGSNGYFLNLLPMCLVIVPLFLGGPNSLFLIGGPEHLICCSFCHVLKAVTAQSRNSGLSSLH